MLLSVLSVAVFLVGITTTNAARKDPGLPGNHLVIEDVQIDLNDGANGQLTITGDHFDFGNTLNVTLGAGPVSLNIGLSPIWWTHLKSRMVCFTTMSPR